MRRDEGPSAKEPRRHEAEPRARLRCLENFDTRLQTQAASLFHDKIYFFKKKIVHRQQLTRCVPAAVPFGEEASRNCSPLLGSFFTTMFASVGPSSREMASALGSGPFHDSLVPRSPPPLSRPSPLPRGVRSSARFAPSLRHLVSCARVRTLADSLLGCGVLTQTPGCSCS